MSNEDADSTLELQNDEQVVHNPKEGSSAGDDSGFFLSPQPLTSKLVRCASTPLSDKGLQSLLTLDFGYHSTEGRDRSGSDACTSNLSSIEEFPELVRSHSVPQIKHVHLDPDEGHQESQELVLSFRTPDSSERQTKGQQADQKIEKGAKERVRLLSDDEFRSDSGIGSDLSILSATETSQCTTPGLPSTSETSSALATSKDRDIFDSKKKKKKERGATARPLQRTARFAHIPG
jgi:hypothetical protein